MRNRCSKRYWFDSYFRTTGVRKWPFVGVLNGESHAIDPMDDMDAQEKADLETDIESVPIPGWKIDATVVDDNIDVDLGGLFFGTRIFGLNLGVRF